MTHTNPHQRPQDLCPDLEPHNFLEAGGSRRLKAAIALSSLWGVVLMLHLWVWGSWLVYGVTFGVGVHLFKLLFTQTAKLPEALPSNQAGGLRSTVDIGQWPHVSILVSAKNEVAVIAGLVESLANLDYPRDRYDLWMVDDNSDDGKIGRASCRERV